MNGATRNIERATRRNRNGQANSQPVVAGQPHPEEDLDKSTADILALLHWTGTGIIGELNREVVGQEEMKMALSMAIIADLTVASIGDSSTGKTLAAETLGKALGIRTHLMAMHPETTHADINGYNIRNPVTGEIDYVPSPFLVNELVIGDEFNRISNKGAAALLKVLKDKQVIVGSDKPRQTGPALTCVMAMNAPGTDGTQPLIDPLIDRIDLAVNTTLPTGREMELGLTRGIRRRVGKLELADSVFKKAEKEGIAFDPAEKIVEARAAFNKLLNKVSDSENVIYTVVNILTNFNSIGDEEQWSTSTRGHRKTIALLSAATAYAAVKSESMPEVGHVWKVAPLCLGLLKPGGRHMGDSHDENMSRIRSRLNEMELYYEDRDEDGLLPSDKV